MSTPLSLRVLSLPAGQIVKLGKAADETKKLPESQMLTEASLGIWENQTIPWPEDFAELSRLLEVNPWHNACCRIKAQDVTSQGWKLVNAKEESEDAPQELLDFFNYCNPEQTLGEVLNDCWVDYEAVGNFDLEVARQQGGKKYPAALYHIPTHTVRKLKDGRYLQMRGGLLRYFNAFGEVGEKVQDPQWKGQNQSLKDLHEIISLKNYIPRSSYYGLPDCISALGAITGHIKQRDANIKYFENGMMAEFIITVSGGTLDEDTEKHLADVLQEMKGSSQAHKTLILHIGDKEAQIKIEKLTPELNYTQQRLYRLDNRDEVIQAHRVPPKLVGIEDSKGGLHANQNTQLDIYFENIVTPRQKILSRLLTNTLIRRGFGIEDWSIVFTAKVLEDQKEVSDVDCAYLDRGVLTPNEVRSLRFPGKEALKGGDTPLTAQKQTSFQPAEGDLKALNKAAADLPTRDIETELFDAMHPYLTSFANKAADKILAWDGSMFKSASKRGWFKKTDASPDRVILSEIMSYLDGQWAEISTPLAEVVYAAKVKGGERAVRTQYDRLNIKKEFNLTNPRLLQYYRTEAAQDIKGIGETTLTQVRAALVTSAENGEVVRGQLSERIQGVLDGISTTRAQLIAEQEVTNAYSYLQHESRVRLGVQAKQWETVGDEHVRPDHQAMAGVTVGVNQFFTLPDGSVGLYPRARTLSSKEAVRCRCDILDVVDSGWDIPTDPWSGD